MLGQFGDMRHEGFVTVALQSVVAIHPEPWQTGDSEWVEKLRVEAASALALIRSRADGLLFLRSEWPGLRNSRME